MSKHCDFQIVQIDTDRVFIVDLDLGNKSVTNDAEYVIGVIQRDYPGKRLIYRDSGGVWDEITGNSSAANFVSYDFFEGLPKGY